MSPKVKRELAKRAQVDLDLVIGTYIPTIIAAMKQAMNPQCEFTSIDWKEAEQLLKTCAVAVWDNRFHPPHAKEMIRDFRNGYGWWLTWIEKGLQVALDIVPDPGHFHPQLWGAFRMMKPLLYEVDAMATQRVKGWPYTREWEQSYLEKQFANS